MTKGTLVSVREDEYIGLAGTDTVFSWFAGKVGEVVNANKIIAGKRYIYAYYNGIPWYIEPANIVVIS